MSGEGGTIAAEASAAAIAAAQEAEQRADAAEELAENLADANNARHRSELDELREGLGACRTQLEEMPSHLSRMRSEMQAEYENFLSQTLQEVAAANAEALANQRAEILASLKPPTSAPSATGEGEIAPNPATIQPEGDGPAAPEPEAKPKRFRVRLL